MILNDLELLIINSQNEIYTAQNKFKKIFS